MNYPFVLESFSKGFRIEKPSKVAETRIKQRQKQQTPEKQRNQKTGPQKQCFSEKKERKTHKLYE